MMWTIIRIGAQHFLYTQGQNILVDCGIGKDLVKKLLRETGTVETCLITHAHTDHYGGLKHLLKASPNTRLFALPGEFPFLVNPGLEPALLFGGYFPNTLASRWLLGPTGLPVAALNSDRFPDINLVSLPGHSPDLFGIAWDDILFTSDALFGQEILTKYPLLYHYDPSQALETLRTIENRFDRFLPAHGSPGGHELLWENRSCIERAFQVCEEIPARGATPLDEVIRLAIDTLAPATNLETYFLNRSALSGYISVLERDQKLTLFLDSGRVLVARR